VEVGTGDSVMHELLVRLVGPDGKIVPAAQFLSLAERHGVIKEIDRWVLDQAVELALAGRKVTLNVSALTMSDPHYAEAVVQTLAERDADPALITFEITETALVENFDQARTFAHEVGALGCTLALDDFGTGYGTLTYLKQLPAHYLKLDREFVADAVANPRSRAVIKGIVTLAHSFGQRTVAEGVEDRETLELLLELGVDYAQGFFIGRPSLVADHSVATRR
jgi:EAL domain-containing protein (putative c-di-GMP-specific phosphodiesterase class I)